MDLLFSEMELVVVVVVTPSPFSFIVVRLWEEMIPLLTSASSCTEKVLASSTYTFPPSVPNSTFFPAASTHIDDIFLFFPSSRWLFSSTRDFSSISHRIFKVDSATQNDSKIPPGMQRYRSAQFALYACLKTNKTSRYRPWRGDRPSTKEQSLSKYLLIILRVGIMPRNYSRKTDRQRWDTTSMEKAFQAINNNEARRRFNGS
ncbi:unnamed protein product [Leptidea sinapis]|uniref:Uncharacterized protein n=1 Tax=Leptidea sinapis TaxID=189913 RepID=A0A5E4R291_9NEOP|nr:unnamed protein product [Leptidea sinapis]